MNLVSTVPCAAKFVIVFYSILLPDALNEFTAFRFSLLGLAGTSDHSLTSTVVV
jgi:hypothetical protein